MPIRLLLLSLLFSSSCLAQVYQSTDEHGNPSFSDHDNKDAKTITIPETNTTQAIAPKSRPTKVKQAPPISRYKSLSISSPRDNSVINNGLYPFTASLAISPALLKGHKIQLLIDGQPHSSGSSLKREVSSITRGKHTLSAKVIDNKNKNLISSASVTITVYRPSTHSKKK